jgi:hypothetical protein
VLGISLFLAVPLFVVFGISKLLAELLNGGTAEEASPRFAGT